MSEKDPAITVTVRRLRRILGEHLSAQHVKTILSELMDARVDEDGKLTSKAMLQAAAALRRKGRKVPGDAA
ncbi:MAG: hypothetical protein AAGE52_42390 [Myxococcota bacterium]